MDRDFDKEKILDKMRELRDKRDLELLNIDLENINLNSDYNRKLLKNKVLNVKYLGSIEYNGEEKGIYLLTEQKENSDGSLAEIEKYYTEDGEFLGGNNNLDQYEELMLKEEYLNNDELLNKLKELDKEGILDLNKIENERLEELARELGVDVKDLKRVAEIETDKEINDDEKEEIKNKEENKEREVFSKEEVQKISTKTEIRTNQKVTDKDTMASLLNVQDKGYTKIAVVYSDKISENNNSTRFTFVGIKQDGSAEKINTLEQAYGSNPTKNIQTLNRDGSKIEEDKVNSIFRIKGKDEEQLAVNIGQMGTIEPKFVRTPRQKGQEAISIPIETKNIWPTTRETREFMNRSRNTRVDDNIEKVKKHEEVGCKDVTIKEVNDNHSDDGHKHIVLSEEYLDTCATKILENENVSSVYNREDVKNRLREVIAENKEIDTEELVVEVGGQMEQDAEKEHQRSEHNN